MAIGKIEFTKVVVILTDGMDYLYFHTEYPEPVWPFEGSAAFVLQVAHDQGCKYVQDIFGIEPEVKNVRT